MSSKRLAVAVSILALGGVEASRTLAAAPVLQGSLPAPLPLFPASNWWNADVSAAPVDPGSSSFIAFIGTGRGLHPDFGGDVCGGCVDNYGFSWSVVDATQPRKAVDFLYHDESDGVDHATGISFPFYPIPDEAITQPHWVEGGPPGNIDLRGSSDRHILVVDRDAKLLYELWNCWWSSGAGRWSCGSGARFDLASNSRRPDGWTSADAAGLAILPGLVRYDEAFGTAEIGHAFRVTVRSTNGYVYPASHRAGSTPGALPMGARLRLKSARDISGFTPELQRIFRAMKKHGLIVADNGSDLYVSGSYDNRWDNDVLNPAFRALHASDFEVIQLGWQPAVLPPSVTAIDPAAGTTAGGTIVHISGSGFEAGATLQIGGVPAAVLAIPDATRLLAVTGAHAAGTVDVVLSNPSTGSALLSNGFSYCGSAPPAPAIVAAPSVAVGALAQPASTTPLPGSRFVWSVVGGALRSGQGSAAISFDAGPPGTTLWLGAVNVPTGGCASAAGARAVQVDFLDVPPADPFHDHVNTVARNGVTAGCGGGNYCPDSLVTRAQMAVFLLRGKHGWGYAPAPARGGVFGDVPASAFAAAWIEALAQEGITGGCGNGLYCPDTSVTRAQMAVFLLRARHGASWQPPPAAGTVFGDVPASAFAASWIEALAQEGITGGCGSGNFCPGAAVTRGQMAVFLVRAFGLQ